jgi:hypothetical protein
VDDEYVSKEAEPPTDGRFHRDSNKKEIVVGQQSSTTCCSGDNDYGSDGAYVMNVPQEIQQQAWMVQNYEFNVKLLEKCQNEEEFNTCLEICNSLCRSAQKVLEDVKSLQEKRMGYDQDAPTRQAIFKLQRKLTQVKELQRVMMEQKKNAKWKGGGTGNLQTSRQQEEYKTTFNKGAISNPKKSQPLWATTNDQALQQRILDQEEHIDALQENINELLHNGISMGVSLTQQNQLLEKLDSGADELREETKMITRRADRLVHRSVSIVYYFLF